MFGNNFLEVYMKKLLSLLLATVMLLSSVACAVSEAPVTYRNITVTSSDAEEYAELLHDRIGVPLENIVLGIGDSEKYGVDMSEFEDDGYIIKTEDSSVVIFGKTSDALGSAVRKYANSVEDGVILGNITYHEGYRIEKFTLLGRDISEYKIIHSSTANKNMTFAATELQLLIEKACGVTLPIEISDEDVSGAIILRHTDDEVLNIGGYRYYHKDGSLVIEGAVREGVLNGVYKFLEDECGWDYLYYGPSELRETDHLVIGEDVFAEAVPAFEYFYETNLYESENDRSSFSLFGSTMSYPIRHANHGMLEHQWSHTDPTIQPCYSSETVIDEVVCSVSEYLVAHEEAGGIIGETVRYIDISGSDNNYYCMCSGCCNVLEEELTLSGTVIRFANDVSTQVNELFPGTDIMFLVFAYLGTWEPPAVSVPNKWVSVSYCPNGCCINHKMDGSMCDPDTVPFSYSDVLNTGDYSGVDYARFLEKWCTLSDNMYVWYYQINMNFNYHSAWDLLYYDFQYMHDLGVRGMYFFGYYYGWGIVRVEKVLAYKLLWNIDMTWEEYVAEYERILEVEYGDGWEYVRDHLDMCREAQNDKCWDCWEYEVITAGIKRYDMGYIATNFETSVKLLEAAAELADTPLRKEHCERLLIETLYRGCQASYFAACNEGDGARISGYYDYMLSLMAKYNIDISKIKNLVSFSIEDNIRDESAKWDKNLLPQFLTTERPIPDVYFPDENPPEVPEEIAAVIEGSDRAVIADKLFLYKLDEKANDMKDAVLSTASDYTVGEGGRIFYFSADGDDTNDGLSEAAPKKTISALKDLRLYPGDVVLFRRGDTFRGYFEAKTGVTYSAWGEGNKPIINVSERNFADPKYWKKSWDENVWYLTSGNCHNTGIMLFNSSGEYGKYDELTGIKKILGVDGFEGQSSLSAEREFYFDLNSGKLFLYCAEGNPGDVYDSIEIGSSNSAISVFENVNDVTIDNLHITMAGVHGVSARTCSGLTVRNCVFNWIGGSILTGYNGSNTTRFGNAVELYGGAKDYTVYNNWIYQIYDTGITHQYSTNPSDPENIHDGVEYYDNLIEYCFWGIEYYNYATEGTVRETRNVYIHDNLCRFGGEGWGCAGRESIAMLNDLNFTTETCENYVIENNTFDRCLGVLLRYTNPSVVEFRNNTYIQNYGAKFAEIFKTIYNFDATALETLEMIGDTTSKVTFILPAPEADYTDVNIMNEKISSLEAVTSYAEAVELLRLIETYDALSDDDKAAVENIEKAKEALNNAASFFNDVAFSVKVMSFNVYYNKLTEERIGRVCDVIMSELPDIIGIQEGMPELCNGLDESFYEIYAQVGLGRDDPVLGENCNIFFNKDKFDLLDYGTFWLSLDPDNSSLLPGAQLPRIATYVYLKRLSDGKEFIHLNTHYDLASDAVRRLESEIIVEFIEDEFGSGLPVVITGDFNCAEGSPGYSVLTDAGYRDTNDYGEILPTFQGWGTAGEYIDFIFTNSLFPAVSYKVCNVVVDGEYASDHNAIVSDLILFPTYEYAKSVKK